MTDPGAVGGFRSEVRSKAPDELGGSDVERALDYFVGTGQVGRAFVNKCVQLAGQFAEQRRAITLATVGGSPDAPDSPPPPPALEPTPLAIHTGAEWIRILTPRIQHERAAIWGDTAAPWTPEEWDDAVSWLREEEELGRGLRQRGESEEVRSLWAELRTVVSRLQQTHGGQELSVSRPRWFLRIMRRGPEGKWEMAHVDAYDSQALQRLGRLSTEVHDVTGFKDYDVAGWVLFGIPPEFERAHVDPPQYRETKVPMFGHTADGQPYPTRVSVTGKGVVVTFRTPDITNDDLRAIREQVQWMWGMKQADDSDDRRFTATDRMVLRAWREAGGASGGRGAAFWEAVRARWALLHRDDPEVPPPPANGEAVRRYHHRTNQKIDLLDHIPSGMEDSNGEA
jgi:hypothetical protein